MQGVRGCEGTRGVSHMVKLSLPDILFLGDTEQISVIRRQCLIVHQQHIFLYPNNLNIVDLICSQSLVNIKTKFSAISYIKTELQTTSGISDSQ